MVRSIGGHGVDPGLAAGAQLDGEVVVKGPFGLVDARGRRGVCPSGCRPGWWLVIQHQNQGCLGAVSRGVNVSGNIQSTGSGKRIS
jgi:hypothetical protein